MEAVERLRYFTDTYIEIEKGTGLEASAATYVFHRARGMRLRV